MSRVVGDLNTPKPAWPMRRKPRPGWPGWACRRRSPTTCIRISIPRAMPPATCGAAGRQAVPVQHHHAHIATVCAEHGERGPVIGLALDGVGLGTDNTPWGGELLRVEGARFERLGHSRRWRCPAATAPRANPGAWPPPCCTTSAAATRWRRAIPTSRAPPRCWRCWRRNLNCPRTSSAGRLFDAASGLLGLCLKMEMDAEAAIKLEQAATRASSRMAGRGRWPMAGARWRRARPAPAAGRTRRPARCGAGRRPVPCDAGGGAGGLDCASLCEAGIETVALAGAASSTVCCRPACVANWKLDRAARAGADQAGARRCGVGAGAGLGGFACFGKLR
jgi:hypothetical protein